MPKAQIRLAGVELYFDDLRKAKRFYRDVLGLPLSGETPGHHAQFSTSGGFVCLERKGAENYPSRNKAVVFLEVPNVAAAVKTIGRGRFAHVEIAPQGRSRSAARASWAVLHDPEGHNILLLERPKRRGAAKKKQR
jgi:catechol 2,3-dioxygenase-like lactoylglutathione lyase family enzyme